MNLTHRNQRDYLATVSTNTSHRPAHSSQEKDINQTNLKIDSDKKLLNLQQAIQNLTLENESMNAMIRSKNQQIANLKSQLKGQIQTHTIQDPRSNIKQIYHLNSFQQQKTANQGIPLNSVQLDKASYQIRVLTKERDDLLKQLQLFQTSNFSNQMVSMPNITIPQDLISKQQHFRAIQQYEQHISVMASKLSTVHKLQTELMQMNQQKSQFMNDFQAMRGQLMNRIGYCEHLQNQLRNLEQELNNRNHHAVNAQFQNVLNRNGFLQFQIVKLNKALAEKQEKIASMKVANSSYVQISKQAFQTMQNNAITLQDKLNLANQTQKKQTEKAINLQAQINKLNKQFNQKLYKAQNQSEKLKKVQNEKAELTSNFAKTKLQMKSLEKKYYDIQFQLQKANIEIIKLQKTVSINQQCVSQIQIYKKKLSQAEEQTRKFNDAISKIQSKYRQMIKDNERSQELLQQGKKKWQSYDKILKQNAQNMYQLNEKLIKRTQQLEISINNCVNLQLKLRQIVNKNDPFEKEIEQLIRQNTLKRQLD